MEKNTVCMDLVNYTNLVIDHRELVKELEELKTRIIPNLRDKLEESDKEVAMLQVELIKKYISDYRIKNYSYEQVADIDGWYFAIDKKDYEYLYQLGIETDLIIRTIKLVKKEFDEKEESEE